MPPKNKTAKAKKQNRAESPQQDIQAFIRQIPRHAEHHRKLAKQLFGLKLDYSAKSIPLLDKMIKKGWPKEPPIFLDEVVVGFGSYLGEAIRRVHGGEWHFNQEHGLHVDVGGVGIIIFPFAKVEKRFLNGEEDSIGYYYSFIRRKVEGKQNPA